MSEPYLAIFCADLHITDKAPICREQEEFMKAVVDKITFLRKLQRQHKCPIVVAGDFFNKHNPSHYLLGLVLRMWPRWSKTYVVAGQHDLPANSIAQLERSGLEVLCSAGRVSFLSRERPTYHTYNNSCETLLLDGRSWGEELPMIYPYESGPYAPILVMHKHVIHGRKPWPGCTSPQAKNLLRELPKEYQVIVTGDNHIPFVYESEDERMVINPGSMLRMSADQKLHKPRVYLWRPGEAKPAYLPIRNDVINDEHLIVQEERNDRLDTFIARMDGEYEVDLSFVRNLERFFDKNKVPNRIRSLIMEALENA